VLFLCDFQLAQFGLAGFAVLCYDFIVKLNFQFSSFLFMYRVVEKVSVSLIKLIVVSVNHIKCARKTGFFLTSSINNAQNANVHQAVMLNFVKSEISCQNDFVASKMSTL